MTVEVDPATSVALPRKRAPLSKRKRFEVFKRDLFTCQYCGKRPPEVVLEADHINAWSSGGSDDIDNLITACEPCNRGKSDKPLEVRAIRPDADLMYLETQQEIAELQRFQEAFAARDAELTRTTEAIQATWVGLSGLDWHPSDRVLRQMLAKYAPIVVLKAATDVAPKVGNGYQRLGQNSRWVPYMWSVCRNLAATEDESPAADNGYWAGYLDGMRDGWTLSAQEQGEAS